MKTPTGHVYLAGPDVFYPDAIARASEKKAILAALGLEGHFPFDNEFKFDGRPPEQIALEIGRANEEMIVKYDIVLANMKPWHGPSMDVGTSYEMGMGRGLQKIVVGYTPDQRPFSERVTAFLRQEQPRHPEWTLGFHEDAGVLRGPDGMLIESFGRMADNLMLVNAIVESGGSLEIPGTFREAAVLAATLWRQKCS